MESPVGDDSAAPGGSAAAVAPVWQPRVKRRPAKLDALAPRVGASLLASLSMDSQRAAGGARKLQDLKAPQVAAPALARPGTGQSKAQHDPLAVKGSRSGARVHASETSLQSDLRSSAEEPSASGGDPSPSPTKRERKKVKLRLDDASDTELQAVPAVPCSSAGSLAPTVNVPKRRPYTPERDSQGVHHRQHSAQGAGAAGAASPGGHRGSPVQCHEGFHRSPVHCHGVFHAAAPGRHPGAEDSSSPCSDSSGVSSDEQNAKQEKSKSKNHNTQSHSTPSTFAAHHSHLSHHSNHSQHSNHSHHSHHSHHHIQGHSTPVNIAPPHYPPSPPPPPKREPAPPRNPPP